MIDSLNSSFALQEWYNKGSPALPNKGVFKQAQAFPCDACCHGAGP